MRILVIGGSGFVGSHLVELLLLRNEVDVYDIKPPWDNIDPAKCDTENLGIGPFTERFNFRYFYGDICDINESYVNVEDYDAIYHTAGIVGLEASFENVIETERVNVQGALCVLEWMKNKHSVVPLIQIGIMDTWANPYMLSKNQAERYGFMYYECFGIQYASIRFPHIYGPRQSLTAGKAVPNFITQALRNNDLTVFGGGESVMDLMYVTDAAKILLKSLHADNIIGEKTDAVCDGESITVVDLAKLIIKLSGSKSKIRHLPMRVGQPGTVRTDFAEDKKNTSIMLDKYMGFGEGLLNTIQWYRENEE